MFLGQAAQIQAGPQTVQMPGQQLMMLAPTNMAPTPAQQPVQYIFQQTPQPQMAPQPNMQLAAPSRGIVQNLIATPFGAQPAAQAHQPIQIQNFQSSQLQPAPVQFVNAQNTVPQGTFILNSQQIPTQMQLQPQMQLQTQQPQQFAVAAPQPAIQPQPQMVQYMLPNGQIVQALQQQAAPAPTLQLQPAQYNTIQQIAAPAQAQPTAQFFTAQPTPTAFFQPAQPTTTFITSPNGTNPGQTTFIQAGPDQSAQLLTQATGQQATLISPQQITAQQAPTQQQFVFQQATTQDHVIQQQQHPQQMLLQPCNQSPVMLLTTNPNGGQQTMSPVIVKSQQQIVNNQQRPISSGRAKQSRKDNSSRSTVKTDVRWKSSQVPQTAQENDSSCDGQNSRQTSDSGTIANESEPEESNDQSPEVEDTQSGQEEGEEDSRHDDNDDEMNDHENRDYEMHETDENHNQRSDSECDSSSLKNSNGDAQETESASSSPATEMEVQHSEEEQQKKEGDSCHFTDSEEDDDEEENDKNNKNKNGEIKMLTKNGLSKAAYELIDNKLLEESPAEANESKEVETNIVKEDDDSRSETKESNSNYFAASSPCSVDSSVNSQNHEASNVKGSESHIFNIKERFYNGIDLDEIREFAKRFKLFRQSLDLTQSEVGNDLGQLTNITQSYSQSAICRFENLDVTPKSALKIKPILESWIIMSRGKYKNILENMQNKSQNDNNNGDKSCDADGKKNGSKIDFIFDSIGSQLDSSINVRLEPGKKRKKRTSFNPLVLEQLNKHFAMNPKPSSEELTKISRLLNYEKDVIRVWFCNKRQTLKANKLLMDIEREYPNNNNDSKDSSKNNTSKMQPKDPLPTFQYSTTQPRIPLFSGKLQNQLPTQPQNQHLQQLKHPFPVGLTPPPPQNFSSMTMPSMFNAFGALSGKPISGQDNGLKNQLIPANFTTVQKNILGERMTTLVPVTATMFNKKI